MGNIWIYLTLVCAFLSATSDAAFKKYLNRDNEYLIIWLQYIFALPGLYIALYLSHETLPRLGRDFYGAISISLPIETIATILYIKAIRLSPLSLTVPFLSLTPLFLIAIAWFITGQGVSLYGGIGIVLIALGGYFLNIGEIRKGFIEPFKAIARERGSVYMIIVAFLYAFTSAFCKVGVDASRPIFFATAYLTSLCIIFGPVAYYSCRQKSVPVFTRTNILAGLFIGVIISLSNITHFLAVGMSNISYMIAIKRLSMVFGVLYGFYLFKEAGRAQRFIGTIIMLFGFIVIVTSLKN